MGPASLGRRIEGRERLAAAVLIVTVFAVYLATLALLYPALPVIERAADTITGYADVYPPFRVDENSYYEIARHIISGTLYEDANSPDRGYPPGFPLAAAPFILLFGPFGLYLANTVIVTACVGLFYLLARRYTGVPVALVFTMVFAFATTQYSYAVSGYSEPLAQFLVLAMFLLAVRAPGAWTETGGRRRVIATFAAAGVLAGLVLFVRPHYILLAAPVFLYLTFRGRRGKTCLPALAFAGGAAVVMALWLVRNAVVFGSPLAFEYSRLFASFIPGQANRGYMEGNVFLGIHRILFDQYHGLFTITPILLLFPAGLHRLWRTGGRAEVLLFGSSVVLMTLFAAAGAYPFTEFGLGSRHLVPVMPLMMLPVAVYLGTGGRFARGMVVLLAAYSFYQAGIGWFTGGEPGKGFFLGILNDNQSRAIILARKGLLPERDFKTREELLGTYIDALRDANLERLLQTINPHVIKAIEGNERQFMLYLRGQTNPLAYIQSADPDSGIVIDIGGPEGAGEGKSDPNE